MTNTLQAKLSLRNFFTEPTTNGGWQLKWDVYQALAIVVGVIMLLIYSWRTQGLYTFAVCILIAAMALAAGLLFGFLFGIPKSAQQPPAPPQAPLTGSQQPVPPNQPGTSTTRVSSKANTNLVEISDWLTKMIVGVGLYSLSSLPGKLKSLASYFATAFGPPAAPAALVMAILGYFGIFGFLLGYLWARIYLTKEFDQNDVDEAGAEAGSST
jgi:hypothetical protein